MAVSRPTVPPFGNWESDEVPYTMYFDNARKGKKGAQSHQNDNQESVEPVTKDNAESEAKTPKHERQTSPEDPVEPRKSTSSPKVTGHKPSIESETRRLTDSPLRQELKGGRTSSNSPHHRYGGSSASETPKRVARHSVGSDRSNDQSPLHPHSQARVGGRSGGISSPSWERKAATSEGSHGLAPSTPGRSRLRSVTRGSDSPDRGPAVPKFGEWDENDPTSGEGFTHIFNRVSEEKQREMGKVPIMPTDTSYSNGQKHYGEDNAKGCGCFPWGKK